MTERLPLGFRCLIMSLTRLSPLIIAHKYVLIFIHVLISSFYFGVSCCVFCVVARFYLYVLCYVIFRVWSLH